MAMKQDKWTGTSWRLEGNNWVEIADSKRDWQPIDSVLAQALKLPPAKNQSKKRGRSSDITKKEISCVTGYPQ